MQRKQGRRTIAAQLLQVREQLVGLVDLGLLRTSQQKREAGSGKKQPAMNRKHGRDIKERARSHKNNELEYP
jgi:hypothetical protein